MEALLRSVEKTMENFVTFMKATAEGFELINKVIESQQETIHMLEFWCVGITVWLVILSWRSRNKK